MTELKEYVEREIEGIEQFYINAANLYNTDYEKVYETPLQDLPLLIGKNEYINSLVSVKLNNKDNIALPKYTHRALWNVSIDEDDVRKINFHDGVSITLTEVCKRMKWKDLEQRAYNCVYND